MCVCLHVGRVFQILSPLCSFTFVYVGCACCNVSGKFKEAVSQVVRSKHNFDHLVIEVSLMVTLRRSYIILHSNKIETHSEPNRNYQKLACVS